MREEAEIVNGDPVRNFVLLSNGHDGRSMLDIGLTTVRVVCQNTLNLALSTREKSQFFSFRHTRGIHGKTIQVQDALKAVSAKFSNFVEDGKKLAARQITRKELDEFLIKLELERANDREQVNAAKVSEFKRTDKYRQMLWAFENSPGNIRSKAEGTLWAAVNGVTYYIDHQAPSRKTDNFTTTQQARLNSAWFNGGVVKKNRAFELALQMAGKV
jgi:phage/plasmid-like protein (TIGR03299 family)